MKIIFLFIFFYFFDLKLNAQEGQELLSNNWRFSQSDTLFFSQAHIKANKIKQVKEYLINKIYADTALLTGEYSFDSLGLLTRSKNYNVYGLPSEITEFKVNANGKITEIWFDRKGILTKEYENIFSENKLMKQLFYYEQGIVSSREYAYQKDGLLSSVQYYNLKGMKETRKVCVYDSLKRLTFEISKDANDSVMFTDVYKYDDQGRKCYIGYQTATFSSNQKIDYSRSTATSIVEGIYSGNTLVEISTKKFNQRGLVEMYEIDKRMSIKRRRKKNMFCGYSGPSRYQKMTYEYDAKGNLIAEKQYTSPNKIEYQTNYGFDSNGNLIHKVGYIKSKKYSEWIYKYF
jgi:hypothetical protein